MTVYDGNSDTSPMIGRYCGSSNSELVPKNKIKKTIPFKLYHLGKWKLEGTTLSNRAGFTLTGNWQIPSVGTPGTIQNTDTGGCLSVNANTDAGSVVVEEDLDSSDDGQQWERLSIDDSGFFNLRHRNSGLFLTMKIANILTIGNT